MGTRLIFLALLLVSAGPIQAQRGGDEASDRAAFERGLRTSSAAAFFAALERNYPEDARQLTGRLFALARANRGNVQAVAPAVAQEVAGILRSKAGDIRNAPAAALLRVMRLKTEFLQSLRQQNIELCGRFAAQNPGDVVIVPPALRSQAGEINIALIEAAGAGSRSALLPGRSEISEQDRAAYVAAMQQLDTDGTLFPLMLDPVALRAAPASRQCAVGQMVYQAALNLPEEVAGNVAAFVLVFELGTQPGQVQTVR